MIEQSTVYPYTDVVGEVEAAQSYQQTLAKTVKRIGLTDNERRAIIAADALPISFHQKQVLVATHIFQTEPMSALRVHAVLGQSTDLGLTIDQVVEARNQVITDPDYVTLWRQHQTLTANPVLAAVAIYKRAHLRHAQIAEKLGTDINSINKMSEQLADIGLTERSVKVGEFNHFCERVREIDSHGKPLPLSELSRFFGCSEQKVFRARKRNRQQGKPSTLGRGKEYTAQATAIQKAILTHPKMNDSEIAALFTDRELTPHQVQWQRFQLHEAGKLQRSIAPRLEDSESLTPSRRLEAERQLTEVLDAILHRGEKVILVDLKRNGYQSLNKISMTTLQGLYWKIAGEHSVPTLHFPRPHKVN